MNCRYLTDGVGTRGKFSASFALLVSSPNEPWLTHLFPAFLALLYQEPGKPIMLVFVFFRSCSDYVRSVLLMEWEGTDSISHRSSFFKIFITGALTQTTSSKWGGIEEKGQVENGMACAF